MKKLLLGALSLILCFFASGCGLEKDSTKENNTTESSVNTKGTYIKITQEEAKNIMNTEKDIIILDVRTKKEYEQGHIPNAILVSNEEISSVEPKELPNKAQKILVYCRSGNRSKQAAQKLADMGYTKIYEFGGINTWQYETVA